MSKKMFMFWDAEEKRIVTATPESESLRVTIFGEPAPIDNVALPMYVDRYTPLRCAQHAPMLKDETGEVRQLMEGDVIEWGNIRSIIINTCDALMAYESGYGLARILSKGNYYPGVTKATEDHTLLGNALTSPSLVADWSNLPDWDLLRERVEEWKAAQVEVDPRIMRIREILGTYTISNQEILGIITQLEAK